MAVKLAYSLFGLVLVAAFCSCRTTTTTVEKTEYVAFTNPAAEAVAKARAEALRGYHVTGAMGYYRVAKTDTIVSVARRFYGDRKFAREIANVNSDRMKDAGGFRRGLVIVLPAIQTDDGRLIFVRP